MPSRSDGTTVTRTPFDFPVETKSITYKGVTYTFRELTVGENDTCRELATGPNPDDFDGRVMIRAMIVEGSVEPKIAMEDLEKIPQRLYAQFIEIINDLNDPATFQADPGNS